LNAGKAISTAEHGSTATAESHELCDAHATAKHGASASATCSTFNGFAIASATHGGEATASDTAAPICTPNGGTAKVRSSAGNCP